MGMTGDAGGIVSVSAGIRVREVTADVEDTNRE